MSSQRNAILIVEDNVDHIEHLRDALPKDYEIHEADTQEECLQKLNEHRYDLVILDYYLKNHFSGLDILREITQSRSHIPVIMITAYGNEELAVEAMKSGAYDYVRKTLDNRYIDRIAENVEDILNGRKKKGEQKVGSKQLALSFFENNRSEFLNRWQSEFKAYSARFGLKKAFPLGENQANRLFSAFLADIQNDRSTETLLFLKRLVLLQEEEQRSLVSVELLNMTFRDVAREMLRKKYPGSFDGRSALMNRIGMIVDENDFELSVEYEKLLAEAIERMRHSERLATKSKIITTLHHEIRQPLTFIFNTAEMFLQDPSHVNENSLKSILEQTRRIDEILTSLEKDTTLLSREYSEDLHMFDIHRGKD